MIQIKRSILSENVIPNVLFPALTERFVYLFLSSPKIIDFFGKPFVFVG